MQRAAVGVGLGRADGPGCSPVEFEGFVEPHWTAMSRLARRGAPDAWEDVLQEALAAAWRHRARFDPARGAARTWLLAIVADQAQKSRPRRRRSPDLRVAPLDLAPDRDHALHVDIDSAVRALARRQRVTVALYYYLDLPVAEIADVLGCSTGTVKSTLSDARGRLRELLGEDYR